MMELNGWKRGTAVFLFYASTLTEPRAQTFRTLAQLGNASSEATLVQGADGELYGTTYYGGVNFTGTVFKITAYGKLTTLYSFCAQVNCLDGLGPAAGLVLGTDGDFYGTTFYGGSGSYFCSNGGCGTVFKIGPRNSAVTTLYRFCVSPPLRCLDGYWPEAVLVQASNGDFYGTTQNGGAYFDGTVFKITLNGTLKTLYSFCAQANCADGSYPVAGLILASDGNFYGTTVWGGLNGPYDGTVFRITPAGKLTTLYNFCSLPNCSDGTQPAAGLIQGTDGDLYGTTENGGAHNAGTVFKITLGGTLTTVYNFCSQTNCNDGGQPTAGLVQASDGNFYGTTYWYGANGIYGTVFKMTPAGALTTLHSFCSQINCADGANPWAGLVQATDGNLYGTTSGGNVGPNSTVFTLNLGLSPFVTFVRNYGKVGQTGGILGQGLAGTTSVAFNGIRASFSVVSDTFMRATVPARATTGYVTATTPSGTLKSNVPFHVIP
jgi:uncharacterized repeat protein (TIGR03803 family)